MINLYAFTWLEQEIMYVILVFCIFNEYDSLALLFIYYSLFYIHSIFGGVGISSLDLC